MWSMLKIVKKQVVQSKTYFKRVEQQLSEVIQEREKMTVQFEKEKSEVIKIAIEQKKRIEEEVRKTFIEAKSQLEKVETQEKTTMKEIKEREISLIKQKEEIKRSFERQITQTKKECYSCDNGVHKLVKDRSQLDRIKEMEKAAGGFLPKDEKPLSKEELMAAMKSIMQKRAQKKADQNQFNKET